ncbi:hypothetical protein Tco_0288393, partial [Tanacetum coccineum]
MCILLLSHTAKNVTRDPAPVADDFNAQDYATLVAHPSPFRKFLDPEEFLCLLYADFMEMALHLEEKFYPHLLTTISCHRWLLTHGMKLVIAKCLNLSEYLFALRAAIGKAIKKGMHDRLSAGITHGKKGRVLTDV